ncbi:hypothetical protein RFI_21217, partial [Reticulomyxa filosa]
MLLQAKFFHRELSFKCEKPQCNYFYFHKTNKQLFLFPFKKKQKLKTIERVQPTLHLINDKNENKKKRFKRNLEKKFAQCLPQIQIPEKVLEKYELKSRRCLRDSVVCVCPKKEDPIFRILTKIRGKYDKRAITNLSHVHLFFPFLPQEIFYEIYAIMTEAIQYYKKEKENEYLQKFELVFETFERYHGTGKQYCYLIPDKQSGYRLRYIQKYMFDCLNHILQSSDNKE